MVTSSLISQFKDVFAVMVALVKRWSLVAAAASVSLVLNATPAVALNNAPVAVSTEAEAIMKVRATFDANLEGVCTGAAVAPTQVLTAQHCIDGATGVTVTGYDGGIIPVVNTAVDSYNGLDVALLNLAESWTGPTLPMSPIRPGMGDVLEFYGMGDGDTLHATTGRVTGFGVANGRYLRDSYNGSVLKARLQSDATAEAGDSGGPIIHNGEIVGVMRGAIRGDSREVIGTPLSSVSEFIEAEGRAELVDAVALPVGDTTQEAVVDSAPQLVEDVALTDTGIQEDQLVGEAALPIDVALAVLVAALLAVGIHSGTFALPELPLV